MTMRDNPDEATPAGHEAGETRRSPTLRCLAVDDDDDIRMLLVRMLEHLGHVATGAADGVEAVERLATARYDLMLLDLTMPRMSGHDVLRWLRDHPGRAEGLRVVVVSALAEHQRAILHELGAHAILPKPLHASQLRELIADQGPAPGR